MLAGRSDQTGDWYAGQWVDLVHRIVSFATAKLLGMWGSAGAPPNLRRKTFELLHRSSLHKNWPNVARSL